MYTYIFCNNKIYWQYYGFRLSFQFSMNVNFNVMSYNSYLVQLYRELYTNSIYMLIFFELVLNWHKITCTLYISSHVGHFAVFHSKYNAVEAFSNPIHKVFLRVASTFIIGHWIWADGIYFVLCALITSCHDLWWFTNSFSNFPSEFECENTPFC